MPDRELRTRSIALFGGAILATTATVVALVLGWMHLRGLPPGGEPMRPPYTPAQTDAALQTAPQPALRAERADAQARLNGIGWVDEARGVAHIPIEEAMALRVAGAASAAAASAPPARSGR